MLAIVQKLILVASIALAAYLVSSAERTSITDALMVAVDGAYRRLSYSTRALLARSRSGPAHAVIDRIAFLENSGWRRPRSRIPRRAWPARPRCRARTWPCRPARRLVDTTTGARDGDRSCAHRQHVLEVGTSVLVGRRSGNEHHVAMGRGSASLVKRNRPAAWLALTIGSSPGS